MDHHMFFKRQPKCFGLEPENDSNLGKLINPSHYRRENILNTISFIMLYYHLAKNNIKHCKRSVAILHDKANHFKMKA